MIKLPEKLLLVLIVATLLFPAPLTLWVNCANPPPRLGWIANRTLYGVTVKKDAPRFRLASWLNGKFQTGLTALASENFAGRELLIRIYNEILYRTFQKSYMIEEAIIQGKHQNLFTIDYLANYGQYSYGQYFKPLQREQAEALVVMMKYLSKQLKELGSSFVFVITPSKASLYPEDIPELYLTKLKRAERGPTNYENMIPLLKQYGVSFVDGRQITLEHKGSFSDRAFPVTGGHWTRAAAFFTAAALLKAIEHESGRAMPQLLESVENIDQHPDFTDDDLFRLLNLIQKPNQRYLHPRFQIPEGSPRRNGILTVVGGSFNTAILNAFDSTQIFQRINQYYYFKVSRTRYPGVIESSVDENAIPWDEDFWNTAAVVLEANEERMAGRHLPAFLMAGLTALEQKLPKEIGVNNSPRPLCWGFGLGENGCVLPKKGFGSAEHQQTWILSQEAEIDLPSPAQNKELQLILEAKPFLGDGVPARVVKVDVNGTPAGTLEMVDQSVQFYSLTIKAVSNSAPLLKLHFSFSEAPSPAPGSPGRFEIAVVRLALVPIGLAAGKEHAFGRSTSSEGRVIVNGARKD